MTVQVDQFRAAAVTAFQARSGLASWTVSKFRPRSMPHRAIWCTRASADLDPQTAGVVYERLTTLTFAVQALPTSHLDTEASLEVLVVDAVDELIAALVAEPRLGGTDHAWVAGFDLVEPETSDGAAAARANVRITYRSDY